MDDQRLVNAAMSALIDGTYGCLDAACETINARYGASVSKSTLSKILSGQLQWPALYIWALEDAAGRYPVSRLRAQAMGRRPGSAAGCLYEASGVASKEVGEAVAAALRAAQSADAGDLAQARAECTQAEDAIARLRDVLDCL